MGNISINRILHFSPYQVFSVDCGVEGMVATYPLPSKGLQQLADLWAPTEQTESKKGRLQIDRTKQRKIIN